MKKRYARDKKLQKKIAKNRIDRLFQLAEEQALSGRLDLANRYVELARKISMRYLTAMQKPFKRRFCRHCYNYLLPPITCRIRIHHGKIIVYCKTCRKYSRIPYKG